MFISKAEKEHLHKKIRELDARINFLNFHIEKLSETAPYGRRKDGTPRKKPGVKKGAKK